MKTTAARRMAHHISMADWDGEAFVAECAECGETEGGLSAFLAQSGSIFILCEHHKNSAGECAFFAEAGDDEEEV